MRLGSLIGELLPLAAFFTAHTLWGLFGAAIAGTLCAALVMGMIWARERRISRFVIFTVVVSALLTLAALAAGDTLFIKIEATLFNGIFATILLGGLAKGRAPMKDFFAAQFNLDDTTWRQLSLRWGLFFATLAIANEIAWRSLGDDGWVVFKVFGMAPATALFAFCQLPLTLRGRLTPATSTTKR